MAKKPVYVQAGDREAKSESFTVLGAAPSTVVRIAIKALEAAGYTVRRYRKRRKGGK